MLSVVMKYLFLFASVLSGDRMNVCENILGCSLTFLLVVGTWEAEGLPCTTVPATMTSKEGGTESRYVLTLRYSRRRSRRHTWYRLTIQHLNVVFGSGNLLEKLFHSFSTLARISIPIYGRIASVELR